MQDALNEAYEKKEEQFYELRRFNRNKWFRIYWEFTGAYIWLLPQDVDFDEGNNGTAIWERT